MTFSIGESSTRYIQDPPQCNQLQSQSGVEGWSSPVSLHPLTGYGVETPMNSLLKYGKVKVEKEKKEEN